MKKVISNIKRDSSEMLPCLAIRRLTKNVPYTATDGIDAQDKWPQPRAPAHLKPPRPMPLDSHAQLSTP